MKKFTGFSTVGIIVGILAVAFIGIAGFLVIDGNSRATNYNNYDFFSVISPDEHNGNIGDHAKVYDSESKKVVDDPEKAKDANIIIYEYADFQCPGCASINPRVNQAVEESKGKLAVVYRSYLLSYHQNATAAASAAEAAGRQGYWKPYADKLFSEQTEWEYTGSSERTALFNKYFNEVTDGKGDLERFNSDLASSEVSQKISFDMGIGKRIDIQATPAFYVEGQLIEWGSKTGGSVTVGGETFTWDEALSGDKFKDLLVNLSSATKAQ